MLKLVQQVVNLMNDLRVVLSYLITLSAYLQILVVQQYRHSGYKIVKSAVGFDVYGLSHTGQWYYIREEQSLYEALRRTGRFV